MEHDVVRDKLRGNYHETTRIYGRILMAFSPREKPKPENHSLSITRQFGPEKVEKSFIMEEAGKSLFHFVAHSQQSCGLAKKLPFIESKINVSAETRVDTITNCYT